MKTKLLFLATFLISILSTAQIDKPLRVRVYVDASATGANNGSSWANAFTDLQSAINTFTNNPAEFWIAAGRYTPGNTSSARSTSFLPGANHKFYGGFNGTERLITQRNPDINITILSGDRANNDSGAINFRNSTRADNFYRIVQLYNDGVVFDGLSFRDAQAAGSTANGSVERLGAAIYASHEFTLENCTFINNFSLNGGVIQLQQQANNANHNISIVKSIFQNNVCGLEGIIAISNGPNTDLTLEIDNCLITDNEFNRGVISANAARNNVTMIANIRSSTIANNFTTGAVSNNQVLRNRQGSNSTCVYNIENSIIWNNFSTEFSSNPPVRLNGLSSGDSNSGGNRGNAIVTHSLLQSTGGATSTNQVLNSDPLFMISGLTPYSLSINSPALDTGNSTLVTQNEDIVGNNRIQGNAVDMGAYEGVSAISATGIVYVDASATGANNGISWTDAYTSLRNAVDSNPNRPVDFWIAAGTYYAGTSRNQSIEPDENHKFYGGFNGTETVLNERDFTINKTIVDGDIDENDNGTLEQNNNTKADNTYRLFQVYNDGVLFDGLVFRNGFALGSTANGSLERMGSAIYASHEFQVENCEFYDNLSFNGGVIQMQQQASGANHDIKIYNSIFQDNYCVDGVITTSNGVSTDLDLEIEGCLITDNTFFNGIVSANAARSGVNMICSITNTTIANNQSEGFLINTHILRNRIGTSSTCTYNVENSIIWNNITNDSNGSNQIVDFNGLASGDTNSGGSIGNATINNTITQSTAGATSTSNVLSNNPLFTDDANKDYTVQSSSVSIDAGNNQFVTLTTDLIGNARITNGTVDIGAYEFSSVPILSTEDIVYDEKLKLKVYPNPTTNFVTIESNFGISTIRIIDLNSKTVMLVNNQNTISTNNLPQGIYFLQVGNQLGQTKTLKLVKK